MIGSICDKKSSEFLSRISEDCRDTEMLVPVYGRLFFSLLGMLTSYSCSDGKEMY